MKLASLKGGRDGRLVIVSNDLTRATEASRIAPTLQAALDDWARVEPHLRERIALAVANVNGCDYCNAAHTAIGKSLKLSETDITAARAGHAADAKADAAVAFARKVTVNRAQVSEADIKAVSAAGFTDAQIVEIVLVVAANVLTNYVNEVFKTPVDFPATTPATRVA